MTSYGSINPTYPTTFLEIEVGAGERGEDAEVLTWNEERALRALGVLGGAGAMEAILRCLAPRPSTLPQYRPMMRSGILALGRLRGEAGFDFLLELLNDPFWARCAAEALGDEFKSSSCRAYWILRAGWFACVVVCADITAKSGFYTAWLTRATTRLPARGWQ